jgi:hypothetical protein
MPNLVKHVVNAQKKRNNLIKIANIASKSDIIKEYGEMCYELLMDSFSLDTKEVNQKLIDRFGMDEFQEIKKKCLSLCSLFGCLLKRKQFF